VSKEIEVWRVMISAQAILGNKLRINLFFLNDDNFSGLSMMKKLSFIVLVLVYSQSI
jgi:hypothetical protein